MTAREEKRREEKKAEQNRREVAHDKVYGTINTCVFHMHIQFQDDILKCVTNENKR
jgi:hypothetical protein